MQNVPIHKGHAQPEAVRLHASQGSTYPAEPRNLLLTKHENKYVYNWQ